MFNVVRNNEEKGGNGSKDINCPRNKGVYQATKGLLHIRNVSVVERGESVERRLSNIQLMAPNRGRSKE
jgi:hypothetical protein